MAKVVRKVALSDAQFVKSCKCDTQNAQLAGNSPASGCTTVPRHARSETGVVIDQNVQQLRPVHSKHRQPGAQTLPAWMSMPNYDPHRQRLAILRRQSFDFQSSKTQNTHIRGHSLFTVSNVERLIYAFVVWSIISIVVLKQ